MNELWYYTSSGKQMEPVTLSELRQLVSSGFLTSNDLVWREGMPGWVKAATIPGLFPNPSSSPSILSDSRKKVVVSRPAERPDRPRKIQREIEPDDDDDNDDEEDDRPRRRRPKNSSGLSGLVVGLISGGVVLFLFIVGLTVFLVVSGRGKGKVANYAVDLGPMMFHSQDFPLLAGHCYSFRVTSEKNTDVDLYLLDLNEKEILVDDTVGPHAFLEWVPTKADKYRVKVINLDRAVANRSFVEIMDLGPGIKAKPAPPRFAQVNPLVPQKKLDVVPPKKLFPQPDPVPVNPDPAPAFDAMKVKVPLLRENQLHELTVTYPEAKLVNISVSSVFPKDRFSLFVLNSKSEVIDSKTNPNCQITFQSQAGETYTIRVQNLNKSWLHGASLTFTNP